MLQVYKDALIVGGISWFVTFLVAIFGNVFILSSIIVRLKQKKNTPNSLILVLSVTDLVCVLCTYIIPGISYISGSFIGGNLLCNLQTFLFVFINTLSVLIVLGVVFERYYAVADPYGYQEHMVYNLKKILFFTTFCIVLSVAIALPTVIEENNVIHFPGTFCMVNTSDISQIRVRINIIFYIVVLSILIFSNLLFNLLSICNVRKMTSFRQQYTTTQNTNVPSEEHLFMRLCLVTMMVFVLLWTPLLVYFILALAKVSTPNWYTILTYRLAALHCVVNPWLYPLLRKRFRHALYWHVTILLHYATLTLIDLPKNTLGEVLSDDGPKSRAAHSTDEQPNNVMHGITQRNIMDYIDAPPPENELPKSHESNSCDVNMQSVSNEVIIDKNSISLDDEPNEYYRKE